MQTEHTLPEFENPPVIETVLGVQFDPLEKFGVPHIGLYFARIRDNYPEYKIHPPIEQVRERFDTKLMPQPTVGIGFGAPEVRCWFIDKSKNMLIQIQKDRFLQNWRKLQGTDVYPHYVNLKPKFKAEWLRYCAFLDDEGIERPKVNQCEVTYINHIEIGTECKSFGEVDKIVNFWSQESKTFLPLAEKVNANIQYVLPGKAGRLHISLQPGIRKADATEIYQLQLTARGAPHSSEIEDILAWFDLGREWIVKGFADLTTEKMHKVWRKKP